MAAAQGKARAACIEASGAVESASAMLEEARSKEPHDYVARLLANGNAGDPVDLVAVAQRKCTDANRQLDLARAGEAALAEGITRAENAVSFAAIRLDSALQEALGAAPEIATRSGTRASGPTGPLAAPTSSSTRPPTPIPARAAKSCSNTVGRSPSREAVSQRTT